MTVKNPGPLTWNVPIVDKSGNPSPEFQRRWETIRSNFSSTSQVIIGNGAPTIAVQQAVEYIDASKTPYVLYVGNGSQWHKVGVIDFTDLADTPHSYTSYAKYLVRVNAAATGLEFTQPQPLGFVMSMSGHPTSSGRAGPTTFAESLTFDATSTVEGSCNFAPTVDTTWTIFVMPSGAPVNIMTLKWTAGSKLSPTLTLVGTTQTVSAGTAIFVSQPVVPDATFADATVAVTGHA